MPNVVSHSLELISVVTKSCEVCRCDFLMRFVRVQDYPHMIREMLHQCEVRKFLLEFLVPATDEQLESVDGDQSRYDSEIRPKLAVQVVEEMREKVLEFLNK